MDYLSIVAVIKNEAPYLKEWIEFHRLQGVERFYLFDNESEDNTKEVLEDYTYEFLPTEKPLVHYEYFPYNPPQGKAYNHCIETLKDKTHWVAFIDADEMLFSPTNKPVAQVLKENYDRPEISGVVARWYLFGSNGHTTYNSSPIIERFTKRASVVNKHCKSIMRLSDTTSMCNDPHSFRAFNNIVNENYEPMPEYYAIIENEPADILRINHYVTKSKAEYKKRRTLPDANSGVMKDWKIMFEAHDKNEVSCDLILKNKKILESV